MARYRTSKVLPAILTVIVIIIAIAGLVALARLIFGGSSNSSTLELNNTRTHLLDTTASRSVSMAVRGPIVADEDFRSYKISISPSERTIRTYKGYLGTVIERQTLPNNVAAYEEFVHALDKAKFAVGTPFVEERNNVHGVCATGRVYEFRTHQAAETDAMLWTSTCNSSQGSLKANTSQLSNLFINQIPDGSSITKSLRL